MRFLFGAPHLRFGLAVFGCFFTWRLTGRFRLNEEIVARVAIRLDPDKDTGAEEADPYVLAMALRFRAEGKDARVVTQENKESPRKMSLGTAAGMLGLASVPLEAFLEFEGIDY